MSNIQVVFTDDQMEVLKNTIAKDANPNELALFVNQCKRTGLDPFTRQIYFIKDKGGKVTICSSIDGLRLVAERTGKYEGQTKVEWCGADGVWRDIWLDEDYPKAARVGVYKSGFREAVFATALFKEYASMYNGKPSYMWSKMPSLMLSKVAEALALRKAFPNDLSGIYSSDEMAEVENQNQARESTVVKPAKAQLAEAKDPYVFEGGKFQGQKFSDVMPEDFNAELAKYEAVPNKTPKLQGLIDRMKKFLSEKPVEKSRMDELNEALGLDND